MRHVLSRTNVVRKHEKLNRIRLTYLWINGVMKKQEVYCSLLGKPNIEHFVILMLVTKKQHVHLATVKVKENMLLANLSKNA